ncbi:MAG: hypothetical protein AAF480_10575 [Actinomycetota bacterium]
MNDPTLAGAGRHHAVLSQIRRDLERDRATPDVLAMEITLSAVALSLESAVSTGGWSGVHDHTAARMRSIGLDDATAAAWASELIRAAGGPADATLTSRRRGRRRRA